MLTCTGCNLRLSADDFYPSNSNRCKLCLREYGRKYRAGIAVLVAASKPADWKRKTLDRAEYMRKWHADRPGYQTAKKRDWYERNPDRARARRLYRSALKAGKLVCQPCEVCGAAEVDGHHEDYSKPLEVVWLCRQHHLEVHQRK